MSPGSSMLIKRLKNGFVIEFDDEVYYPNLRAALRRVAEELAKGEPATEHITDLELEQMIHGAASVPAQANPKLERLRRSSHSPKITASYIAGLKHISWQNPAGRDLKVLVREQVRELHGSVPRAFTADILQRVQEKLAKRQARQDRSQKGA